MKTWRIETDGISDGLSGMEAKSKNLRAWINRWLYPYMINVQRKRFMTENVSEGNRWSPLNPKYAAWKLRRYGGGIKYKWVGGGSALDSQGNRTGFDRSGQKRPWQESGTYPNYPGNGKRINIATGRLVNSLLGEGPGHVKLVKPTSLTIGTTVPYAKDVDASRTLSDLSKYTLEVISRELSSYLKAGK